MPYTRAMVSRVLFISLFLFAAFGLIACGSDPAVGDDASIIEDSGIEDDSGITPKPGDDDDDDDEEPSVGDDVCGDGIRGPTEVCDDGNTADGDGCSADCQVIEDGYLCFEPGEFCVKIVCGNGKLEPGEACDDGNTEGGDGCSADCKLIEPGWDCPIIGRACVAAECGDGIVAGNEECDDGNANNGDGCSSACLLEEGFHCETPGEACAPAVCGNGIVEGHEQCDEGANNHPFKSCDLNCTRVPSCQDGVCAAVCGDGIVFGVNPDGTPEECDDGNTRDGDGCSSDCKLEEGYACSVVEEALPESIVLPVIVRDFISQRGGAPAGNGPQDPHIDFNRPDTGGNTICYGPAQVGAVSLSASERSLTYELHEDGYPILNPHIPGSPLDEWCYEWSDGQAKYSTGGVDSAASFQEWYTDNDRNQTIFYELTLTPDPSESSSYVFDSGSDGFFPIDGMGWNEGPNPIEPSINDSGSRGRNFGFTTETRYWFEYSGDERLEFSGDDDLWVFINGHLCLNVGGLHPARPALLDFSNPAGNQTLADDQPGDDAFKAMLQALQAEIVSECKAHLDSFLGGPDDPPPVFEVAIFHAERRENDSNYKLTLSNFVKRRSVCASVCGDGIVASDEVCDDGVNDGSYGGCMPGCQAYAPYCGDGEVQAGEECDLGTLENRGAYGAGSCNPDCTIGPFCGDGIRQANEQCDDGEANGSPESICSETCQVRFLGPG